MLRQRQRYRNKVELSGRTLTSLPLIAPIRKCMIREVVLSTVFSPTQPALLECFNMGLQVVLIATLMGRTRFLGHVSPPKMIMEVHHDILKTGKVDGVYEALTE